MSSTMGSDKWRLGLSTLRTATVTKRLTAAKVPGMSDGATRSLSPPVDPPKGPPLLIHDVLSRSIVLAIESELVSPFHYDLGTCN